MAEPENLDASPSPIATPGLKRRIGLARAILWAEKIGAHLIAPLSIIGGYSALALLGVVDVLPNWALGLSLIGALAASLWMARGLISVLSLPTMAEALGRVESDSGLRHQPLSALSDSLGAGDPNLWAAYRARLIARIGRLTLNAPRPVAAAADPIAFRALVILGLVAGLVMAGDDASHRLHRAFKPDLWAAPVPPVMEAWVNPPKATLRPPIFLSHLNANDPAPTVPEGSELIVKVAGARRLSVTSADGSQRQSGARSDSLEVHQTLTKTGTVEITADGRALARHAVIVTARQAPKITWLEAPQPARRGALKLAYRAYDHYGVGHMALKVIRPREQDVHAERHAHDAGAIQDFEVELPQPGRVADPDLFGLTPTPEQARQSFSGTDQIIFRDLTSHPWAGLDVVVQLTATNLEGLCGTSEPKVVSLPEREFHHPIARQIIAERKTLAREPAFSLRVARALGALLERPQAFGDDMTAYLALRASVRRLSDAEGRVPEGIFDLLWSTALRIEDGKLSDASKNLRDVQERLETALAQNRPQREIDDLMAELRQAVENYLREMSQQSARDGSKRQSPSKDGKVITEKDLAALMQKAQDLARAGNRDAARQLLAMIQSMFENLGSASQAQPDETETAAGEALAKLGDLMGKQQRLMDQTMRGSTGGPKTPGAERTPGPGTDPNLAAEQRALRKQLGEIVEGLSENGDLPEGLGGADEAMRKAEGALSGGKPNDAAGAQAEALQRLRDSAKALGKQLMDHMAKRGGRGGNRTGAGAEDPLGRPEATQKAGDGGSVSVPDKPDIARAREIMDELRRRAAERLRAKTELDYLDRLLEQF